MDGQTVASVPGPKATQWTPDSRHLVDVSDGEVWTLDVSTQAVVVMHVSGAVALREYAAQGAAVALFAECSVGDVTGLEAVDIDPADGGAELYRTRCMERGLWSDDARVVATLDPSAGSPRFRVVAVGSRVAGPWIEGTPRAFRPASP
jgi:hypothetical protein